MKFLSSLIFACLLSTLCTAQFKHRALDEHGMPMNYRVSTIQSKIPVFLVVEKGAESLSPFNSIPNDPLGSIIFMEGATAVKVTTRLRKDSLSFYRYSVIEDDTAFAVSNALLKKVDFAWPARSDFPGYLTLNFGISSIANKKLTIKIYNTENEGHVTTVIIYNKPIKPAVFSEAHLISESKLSTPTNYRGDILLLKNGASFRVSEKTKGIFISMKKTDLDFVYYLHLSREGEMINLPSNWRYGTRSGEPGYYIDVSYFKKPGDYSIGITSPYAPQFTEKNYSGMSFTVLTSPTTRGMILSVTFLATVCIVGGIFLYFIWKNSKKKVQAAKDATDIARDELTLVRSQLNPHFVFNALGGIQNLMNKNEVEKANEYLDKFARLTRDILNDRDLISIKDEISLLEDYLSMEQLRFSFTYCIETDQSQNFTNTEIPPMLVQPFAENAVKHAMSQLKEEGKLYIRFIKEDDNIIITISDNGKGFDVLENHDGLGIKLSRKRIALLNQMFVECPIKLELTSKNSDTQVKITLSHWL